MLALVLFSLLFVKSAPQPPRVEHSSIPIQSEQLAKGRILENVSCLEDQTQSYALYLPSTYTPDRKWPVLFALDPGARGAVPVERFKEAAEKFQWILIGSNNSRNGSLQQSVGSWNALVRDANKRFAIDPARAYVTGFSGGARASLFFASRCNDCVSGVIACSAGFPVGMTPSPDLHFDIFATAGSEDFNFPEVRRLSEPLTKAGIAHRIAIFEGRHDWLPSGLAIEALEWMELQAMKAGKRARDDEFIGKAWQRNLEQATTFERAQKLYEAFQTYRALAVTFKGLHNVVDIEKKVGELRDHRAVKDAIRSEEQQIKRQQDLEARLRSLIAARENGGGATQAQGSADTGPGGRNDEGFDPATQMQSTLAGLLKHYKNAEDSSDRRVARRVIDGLYIGLFELGRDLLQNQKQYDAAVRTFKLMTEVNPDRPGGFLYLASGYAAGGEKKKALQTLRLAVEKGLTDRKAIEENPAFDSLKSDASYQELLKGMDKKN